MTFINGLLIQDGESFKASLMLMLAVASVWLSRKSVYWLLFLTAAMAWALMAGRITPVAAGAVFGLGITTYIYSRSFGITRAGFFLMAMAGSLALFSHIIPGFNNWQILKDQVIKPGSAPYSLWLNFDKPVAGIFILGFLGLATSTFVSWRKALAFALPMTALAAGVLAGIGMSTGWLKPQFAVPEITLLWVVVNLLFTCVAEEAVFRGLLQKQIQEWLGTKSWGAYLALALSSAIFGLAHFTGGTTYIFLSALAGLFYGYCFLRTKRIEAAIICHFGVNLTHFLFFTYP